MNEDINVGDTVRLPHWPESLTFRVTGETRHSHVGRFTRNGVEHRYDECLTKDHDWIIVPTDNKEKEMNSIKIGDTVRLPHWPPTSTFRVTGETARSLVGVLSTRGIEHRYEQCYPKHDDWIVVPKPRPELPPRLDKWAPVYIGRHTGAAQFSSAEEAVLSHRKTQKEHPGYPDFIAVVRYAATETVRWIGTDGELEA